MCLTPVHPFQQMFRMFDVAATVGVVNAGVDGGVNTRESEARSGPGTLRAWSEEKQKEIEARTPGGTHSA